MTVCWVFLTIIHVCVCVIIYFSFSCKFFAPVMTGGFHWSGSLSPHISRTLVNIVTRVLRFGWSRFFLWPIVIPISFPSFWKSIQVHQPQLVSPSPSCSKTFSTLWQDLSICLFFRFILFSLCDPLELQNQLHLQFFCTLSIIALISMWHFYAAIYETSLVGTVFATGLGGWGSIPDRVKPKTQKLYLMLHFLTLSITRNGSKASGTI